MNQKQLQNIRVSVGLSLMVGNVTRENGTVSVNVNVKKNSNQKIMSEIVAYVLVRVIRLVGGLIVTSDGITKKSRNQL